MEYKVIDSNSLGYMVNEINNNIKNGWKPYGELIVFTTPDGHYYQVMVNDTPEDTIVLSSDERSLLEKILLSAYGTLSDEYRGEVPPPSEEELKQYHLLEILICKARGQLKNG